MNTARGEGRKGVLRIGGTGGRCLEGGIEPDLERAGRSSGLMRLGRSAVELYARNGGVTADSCIEHVAGGTQDHARTAGCLNIVEACR